MKANFISPTNLSLSFWGIVLIIQMMTSRFIKLLSLKVLLTAPDMMFLVRGVDP